MHLLVNAGFAGEHMERRCKRGIDGGFLYDDVRSLWLPHHSSSFAYRGGQSLQRVHMAPAILRQGKLQLPEEGDEW